MTPEDMRTNTNTIDKTAAAKAAHRTFTHGNDFFAGLPAGFLTIGFVINFCKDRKIVVSG